MVPSVVGARYAARASSIPSVAMVRQDGGTEARSRDWGVRARNAVARWRRRSDRQEGSV